MCIVLWYGMAKMRRGVKSKEFDVNVEDVARAVAILEKEDGRRVTGEMMRSESSHSHWQKSSRQAKDKRMNCELLLGITSFTEKVHYSYFIAFQSSSGLKTSLS